MPLYRCSQALAVRDRIFAALENAVVNRLDNDLRIMVVGGGASASRLLADWGVPGDRGVRITVDAQRRVEGLPGVFAFGDVSIGPDELPQLAQPALHGGNYVAALIADELRGKQRSPFVYSDRGTMATIGRASAVAQIKGLPRLKDFPAWAIWVGLHVVTPGKP